MNVPISTIILCGGRGTRAHPMTVDMPKPMLPLNGVPILRHVMAIYAEQGFTSFVLATGYRGEEIAGYVPSLPTEWDVRTVDSGLDADTADRIRACRDQVGDRFFATYGDGVGNVDLKHLLACHDESRASATVTTVPLRSQYGTLELNEQGWVQGFHEKPVLREHWINAGFFVMQKEVLDVVGPNLERDVLPAVAARDRLLAVKHDGFWRSMDTQKEAAELSELAREGCPWLASPEAVL